METMNRRALLSGGVAMLFASPALGQVVWQKWGGAPYAKSFAEATSDKKFDLFLELAGIPTEMRAEAKRIVRTTKGEVIYLTPNDKLAYMMSGPSGNQKDHIMKDVTVGTTVISRGKVEAATATKWRIGTIGMSVAYIVVPDICFNLSLLLEFEVTVAECVELHYPVQKGDIVRFAILGPTDVPAGCLGLMKAGTDSWVGLPAACPQGRCDFVAVIREARRARPGMKFDMQMSGGYVVNSAGTDIMRLPAIFAEEGSGYIVVICIERNGDDSQGIAVEPSDYRWTGPRRAIIFATPEQIPPQLAASGYIVAFRFRKHH